MMMMMMDNDDDDDDEEEDDDDDDEEDPRGAFCLLDMFVLTCLRAGWEYKESTATGLIILQHIARHLLQGQRLCGFGWNSCQPVNSPARHTPLPAGPQTKRGQVTSARIERKFEVNNCWPSQAHPAPTHPARPKQHVFGWDEKVSSPAFSGTSSFQSRANSCTRGKGKQSQAPPPRLYVYQNMDSPKHHQTRQHATCKILLHDGSSIPYSSKPSPSHSSGASVRQRTMSPGNDLRAQVAYVQSSCFCLVTSYGQSRREHCLATGQRNSFASISSRGGLSSRLAAALCNPRPTSPLGGCAC